MALMSEHRDRINEYIRRFGEERGLVLDALNAEGVTQVARGSATVQIGMIEDHGVLIFFAPIMHVPEKNPEAFYRRLLELSFLQTSDAAFAIDKKTDMAYLRILRRLEGLDYEEFDDLLHTIAGVADEWDDKLKKELGRA